MKTLIAYQTILPEKEVCLAKHSQSRYNDVANQLNNRPRKILDFNTPLQAIEKGVALTSLIYRVF